MPFGAYKTLGEALRALQVSSVEEDFIEPLAFSVSDYFRTSLKSRLANCPVNCSESAVCEALLYPVLWEVAECYRNELVVWSHVTLYEGNEILGVPDYLVAKRSPLGVQVLDTPYAMIIDAKKNDFDAGWGQCLAGLHAAQRLNGDSGRLLYGGVSDGFRWDFAKLQGRTLIRHGRSFQLQDLDELMAALNHVLALCKQQVLSPAEAA
jgi:hypothetical protein